LTSGSKADGWERAASIFLYGGLLSAWISTVRRRRRLPVPGRAYCGLASITRLIMSTSDRRSVGVKTSNRRSCEARAIGRCLSWNAKPRGASAGCVHADLSRLPAVRQGVAV
jgi:hypothetical protein